MFGHNEDTRKTQLVSYLNGWFTNVYRDLDTKTLIFDQKWNEKK